MGSFKRNTKSNKTSSSGLDIQKENQNVKAESKKTLHLVEVSEEELKRLRIDTYSYLM